jgi:hypothetical protein
LRAAAQSIFGKVETKKFAFGTEVNSAVRKDRSSPAGIFQLRDLIAGEFLRGGWIHAEEAEESGFPKKD